MATGMGLVPVRKNGAPYSSSGAKKMYIPSTNSSTIGLYEAVKLVNATDPNNEVPVVAQAAAGDALVGVIVGWDASAIGTSAIPLSGVPYRRASTNCYVLVETDPSTVYQIQEDADSGVVAAVDIGSNFNADLVFASSTANTTTATGMSKTMLDSSTSSASSCQVKMVGVMRDKVNAGAQSTGAVLEVRILEHAYLVADSIT